MNQRRKSLVILAAGIGSRFKGGIKQLQSVGPAGECIMDYSIYDALEAGFNQIVFIIRKDIEQQFEELIGNRVRQLCFKYDADVVCVFQDKHDLPEGFACPADRMKPWGTGHALLSCKGTLRDGFVVINADDYYGKDAFQSMSAFLDSLHEDSAGNYALAGFLLGNTLSDCGGVTRGLCVLDEKNRLVSIKETKKIIKTPKGPCTEEADGVCYLKDNTPVSMNMWAFTADVLERLESRFIQFLSAGGLENAGSEFLIPTEIGGMLCDGIRVQIIPTLSKWFGITFAEEIPMVRQALAQMVHDGIYPNPLY